jgi:acetolactate decarboxylase
MQTRFLFLSCPVEALMQGLYRAPMTMEALLDRGDFGIGTFNSLDGEMIVSQGKIHRADAHGRIHEVDLQAKTPFACVTHFSPDTSETFHRPVKKDDFWPMMQGLLPSNNMAYAVRIHGLFSIIRARSVPAQRQGRPLVEATRHQNEFTFKDQSGTLVGFYTPEFIKSLSIPGFHLHFLSQDETVGGHLLDCSPTCMTFELMHIPELRVGLPLTLDFLTADLTADVQEDIKKAER